MVPMRELHRGNSGAGMAGRGRADIGFGLATGGGRWRGRGSLTSGLAAALAALALSGAGALATEPSVSDFDARWGAWGEIGGTWGAGHSSHGEIVLLAPLGQTPDGLVFTDIRGKVYESAIVEGNFALGARRMLPSGWNLGGWGALDVRRTASDNYFGQVSGGVEALSEHFDLRLNGYLPLTGPQTAAGGMAGVILDGANIFMVGGQEVPLAGLDAEAGARLPFAGNAGHVGVYGGGFWFDSPHVPQAIAGGKARVELAVNDIAGAGSRFSAQYEFTHDNVRGDRHLVGARLRIPLGAAPPASAMPAQWRRMADRIERDVDIVIGQSSAEAVEDALTDVNFDQVAYVEDGGSITDTSTDSGDNTLILVNGTVSGAQELQGNQTLQGGGSTIQVRGLTTGAVADFTAPGLAAMLAAAISDNLTLAGNNTHVAGLAIDGGNNGIRVSSNLDNIAITQTSISGQVQVVGDGGIGIDFLTGGSNIIIRDTTVTNTEGAGISIGNNKSNVTISGTTVAGAGGSGIRFDDNNSDVTIAGATIDGADGDGISFGDQNTNVTIASATVTDAGGDGIFFANTNTGVTIINNSITDASFQGIRFSSDNVDITVTQNDVRDAGFQGIQFSSNNNDIMVSRNDVTSGFQGIQFFSGNNAVTVANNNVTADGDGISFSGDNIGVFVVGNLVEAGGTAINFSSENVASITGNTILNPGDDGISMFNDNTLAIANNIFAGTFGQNGILIDGAGNTLNGVGNTAADAIFGGVLCEDNTNDWTGTVVFDGVDITSANCP